MDNVFQDESKTTQLQIRIREDLKNDLRVLAELKGLSVSATVHTLIVKAVRDAKAENPYAFGRADIPVVVGASEIDQILLEAFDGKPFTPEQVKRYMAIAKKTLEIKEIREGKAD